MNNSLRFLIVFSLLFTLYGCVKEDEAPMGQKDLHEVVFHAGWAPETKTVLQEDGSVWWSPGDKIGLFVGNGGIGGYCLTSTNTTPVPQTDFEGEIEDGNLYSAIYPYKDFQYFDGTHFGVYFEPSQEAKEGTFQNSSLISIAQSTNNNLYFKNVSGGIKLSVANEGITKIQIETLNEEEWVCGMIEYVLDENGNPQYSGKGESGNGPKLFVNAPNYSSFEPNKDYYIVLPYISIPSGLKISFYKGEDVAVWKYPQPMEIHRSAFKRLNCVDKDLVFHKGHYDNATILYSFLPEDVGKENITNIEFHVNDSTITDKQLSASVPVYYDIKGTKINIYTTAELFDISRVTYQMFRQYSSLGHLDLSNTVVPKAQSFVSMFEGCVSLKSIIFGDWDSFNVTNTDCMFYGCESLRSLDLSFMNTENVTSMYGMFGMCSQLTVLDLSSFDTHKVTDMRDLFMNCASLTSINLSSFNTENARWMGFMFSGCHKIRELDLSGFNTSSVEDMLAMFNTCSSLEHLDISSFSFDNCTNISSFLSGCSFLMYLDFGSNDLPNGNIQSSGQRLASGIPHCYIRCSDISKTILQQPITGLDSDKVIWIESSEEMPAYNSYQDPNVYYSSDFSRDKNVTVVQRSVTGRGGDLIFIGDAYSDRLIEDGTYDRDLDSAINAVFSLEPMSSYRELFNIYKVYAVSETEIVGNKTALFTQCGNDGYMSSSSQMCSYYASIACPGSGISISGTTFNNATIIVVINSENGSGISYTAISANLGDYVSDYGQSCEAMAFIGKGTSETLFRETVLHEFGHAFAKLADEYFTSTGEMDEDAINYMKQYDSNTGYNKNVDYTNDPLSIKWRHFLNDSRYDGVVGIFEGGHGSYDKGVWRPTANSIMSFLDINSTDNDGFNAPSREAIYYRIHKLAYGESWQYDYETFVQQDLKNIQQTSPTQAKYVPYPARVGRKPIFKMEKSISKEGKRKITIIRN